MNSWLRPVISSTALAVAWAILVLASGGPEGLSRVQFLVIDGLLLATMIWRSHSWRRAYLASGRRGLQFGRALVEGAISGAVIGGVVWAVADQSDTPGYLNVLLVPAYAALLALTFLILCALNVLGLRPAKQGAG